jgi:hypothetical protein
MSQPMKAYAYASEDALLSILDHLRGSPILFATKSLQSGFASAVVGRFLLPSPHASDVNTLLEHLAPDWYSWKGALARLRVTNSVLRRQVGAVGDAEDRALLSGNAQTLKAIELLVEAGVTPDEFRAGACTPVEIRLAEAWRLVEEALTAEAPNLAPEALRTALFEQHSDPSFKNRVKRSLCQALKLEEDKTPKRLVLAGFYFVSPVQYQIFCTLADVGIELIFLNHFDAERPEMFDVWRSTFDNINEFGRLPRSADWERVAGEEATRTDLSERFYARFTGRADTPVDPGTKAIRFETPLDMVRACQGPSPGEVSVIESELPSAGERFWFTRGRNELRDLVSALDAGGSAEIRSLHHTPAGRFLLTLHDCWEQGRIDDATPAFVLTRERFRALMMSGFLQARRQDGQIVNGRNQIATLDNIFEALQGVDEERDPNRLLLRRPPGGSSVECWKRRLGRIRTAVSRGPVSDRIQGTTTATMAPRFVRYLENPNRFISHFRVTRDELDNLEVLVDAVHEVAQRLLSDKVDLKGHLQRLQAWLQETAGQEDTVVLAICANINDALKTLGEDATFHAADLSQALRMMLGDKGRDEQEDDTPSAPGDRIMNFAELDLLHGFAGVPVHIGHLDAKWLPTAAPPVPWPLSRASLDAFEAGRRLMTTLDAKSQSDLFLFYSAIAIAEPEGLQLSWCEELGTEVTTPSPFLLLLQLDTKVWGATTTEVPHTPQTALAPLPEVENHPYDYPIDAAFIHSICPRRYFYDFVANEGPTYRNAFQQIFVMGSLLRLRALDSGYLRRLGMHIPNAIDDYDNILGGASGPEYWNRLSLQESDRGALSVSTSTTAYPVDSLNGGQRVTHRATFRMLLLPSCHDHAWIKWRKRIEFEALEGEFQAEPETRGADQRLSEYLNAYWNTNYFHIHRNGVEQEFKDAKELNRIQAIKSNTRTREFSTARANAQLAALPSPETGDWCRVCPHTARCPRSGVADASASVLTSEAADET